MIMSLLKKNSLLSICLLSITPHNTFSENILDKVSSSVNNIFSSRPCDQTITKEIPAKPSTTLCVKNLKGDITVQAESQAKSIIITATKHTRTPELLSGITVDVHATEKQELPIIHVASRHIDPKVRGTVDYSIIVPAKTKLQLHTDQGIITVNESHGKIDAHTLVGDIAIHHSTNTVTLQTENKGNILVHNAQGPIRASVHLGDINLNETKNSIMAKVEKGRINSSCQEIPEKSHLAFNVERGTITLGLPKTVNASILGKAENGTVTSDHYITLEPQTMKLNMMAWHNFRKEVQGTLGAGGADIKLHNKKGHIRIINTSDAIIA